MAQTLGNLQAGPMWSDVALVAKPGETCAIALSEDVLSDAEWECRVRAVTLQGTITIGSFRTRSPAAGEMPSRLVALAFYPGAVSFVASWRQVAGELKLGGDCTLTSSAGVGSTPGVTPVSSITNGPSATRAFQFLAPVVGVAPQIAPRGTSLYRADLQMGNATVVGANVWGALFDKAGAPVAADVPFWSGHMGVAAPGAPSDPSLVVADFGPNGRVIRNGLWLAASDAAGPLVISLQLVGGAFQLALP